MENILSQTGLPDCKIIQTLISKAQEKKDCDFNFIFQIDEVRKIISDEITRINLLFPEYTPHDEKYHLKKLFYIASELLGNDLIENMNVAELFIFSVSLYAHDWGMAISDYEKECIISKNYSSDVNLLEDEEHRFNEFCNKNNIVSSKIKNSEWQEYIRLTHAFRSGKRIRFFFERINFGIAEVTSRLCEGHYLDIEILDDPNSYPTDYAVLREIVNIKALTIYLRLVDLLDLGEDRTPYVLWKFVAPKNKFSQMEWTKHRALQPVSFPSYQIGRYIQIDGSTSDHNVYMALLDLKRYVNDQFKQSSDMLNRMNHSYHKLDIFHIDWRIAARGFKPIPTQFEFDRMRMFEILGDEIYQKDGYIFIRELIQNSIDAIKLRKELIEKKGLSFDNGKIVIKVNNYNELYYKVSITDNGIGMDEYIIRNYLSVAGKSYYNSKDFEKEGFKMEPISRFGIGILSCFMLSDYIEITTYRDPYISNKEEKLKITIPAKENYFRIESLQTSIDIGTSFNVFILKEKLSQHNIEKLNITEYVKDIAGFVDFPIEIFENEKKVTICRPNSKIHNNSIDQISLSYEFPYESAIFPQNINTVKEYFIEKKVLLKEDLNLDKFEGCITYLIPKDEDIDINNNSHTWPTKDVELININKNIEKGKRVQWYEDWVDYDRKTNSNTQKPLSTRKYNTFSVYLNGILLPNATAPRIDQRINTNDHNYFYSMMNCFLLPQLIVNVPRSSSIKLDLARTTINDEKKWDSQIWEALFNYIKKTELIDIMSLEPRLRYFRIGKLKTFYRFTDKIILEKLITDTTQIPIPILSTDTKLNFISINTSNLNEHIRIPNGIVRHEIQSFFLSYFFKNKKSYSGFLNYRIGNDILALPLEDSFIGSSASIRQMNDLIYSFVLKNYSLDKIEFIKSPLGIDFPWINEIYRSNFKNKIANYDFIELSKKNLDELNSSELEYLINKLKKVFNTIPKLVEFEDPFKDKVFYSWEYMNIHHFFTKYFIKILCAIYIAKEKLIIPAGITGNIIDKILRLPFIYFLHVNNKNVYKALNQNLTEIISECSKYSIIEKNCFNITKNDIVNNSLKNRNSIFYFSPSESNRLRKSKEKWGDIIK